MHSSIQPGKCGVRFRLGIAWSYWSRKVYFEIGSNFHDPIYAWKYASWFRLGIAWSYLSRKVYFEIGSEFHDPTYAWKYASWFRLGIAWSYLSRKVYFEIGSEFQDPIYAWKYASWFRLGITWSYLGGKVCLIILVSELLASIQAGKGCFTQQTPKINVVPPKFSRSARVRCLNSLFVACISSLHSSVLHPSFPSFHLKSELWKKFWKMYYRRASFFASTRHIYSV